MLLPVLRDYQQAVKAAIKEKWSLAKLTNVLAVMPTGAGKTMLMADIMNEHLGALCAIAHRQELVEQISIALAQFGVVHQVICQRATYRRISRKHLKKTGKVYLDPDSQKKIVGVATLLKRKDIAEWCRKVTLVLQDEAHHVLRSNQWGKAAALFPNAKGLYVTATPTRADGKGLGRHADGVIDYMVEGPTMRELIRRGYLCDYKLFCIESDLDLAGVDEGADGDWIRKQAAERVKQSSITGSIVETYCKYAWGKRGITFAIDVEHANQIANEFNKTGVPAVAVDGNTDDAVRADMLERFERGEIWQLVNCDLFGEGFDVPAIECVSMGRPTKSFALFSQQFGRALRILEGKLHALIFDHVGNTGYHAAHKGLPDSNIIWSLDRFDKKARAKKDPDLIPQKICQKCSQPYPATFHSCPNYDIFTGEMCGYINEPAKRNDPSYVDGDLTQLDEETLHRLRTLVARIDKDPTLIKNEMLIKTNNPMFAQAAVNRHLEHQKVQEQLRETMALWGGSHTALGRDDREIAKRFYYKFGIDALTAKSLKKNEAQELNNKLIDDLWKITDDRTTTLETA